MKKTMLCAALLALPVHALDLTGVYSCKTHGNAGEFCMPVRETPLAVEPRAGVHTIVFAFDKHVHKVKHVKAVDAQGQDVPIVSVVIDGSQVEVVVAPADRKRVRIDLHKVNGHDVFTHIGFLVGDVNQSGAVNTTDISAVRARSGVPVTGATFLFDLDATGQITGTDVGIVRGRSLNTLE